MNIDKIKNYNQKILALLGTTILLLAIFGIISILIFTISDLIPNDNTNETALLSDEKLEQLTQQNMRQQVISFNNAILIDTLQQKYIIPIIVRTLKTTESISEDHEALMDMFGSGSYSGKRYRRSSFYGDFNNLVYWDFTTNEMKPICKTRMIASKLEYTYFEDDILVSFVGADVDSNKDGHVTLEDHKNLYLYSFKEQKLRILNQNDATVIDFKYRHNTMDAIVTFGMDRNKNGNYSTSKEPSYLMKYKFTEDKLEPILNKDISNELQALIENTDESNE
ncbi:hypothetical protein [Carboxylicivirga sp. N1Y90]|uniref:hypothetical protein n=1 Tax=Carboxylicivirga fragile TaxID=3417571 RepID=UPI003D353539|nr:hypothetical protein [Marinilabiliaceae bacterium N1Y90]